MKIRILTGLLVCLSVIDTTSGGDTRPPAPAPDPERGSIGVSVKVARTTMSSHDVLSAGHVLFVRLQNDQDDGLSSEEVISSDWSDKVQAYKNQAYLLHAEPGRYVAVGAWIYGRSPGRAAHTFSSTGETSVSVERGPDRGYLLLFPADVIRETEVTVAPGELAFMGKIRLKQKKLVLDNVQRHFMRIVASDTAAELDEAKAWDEKIPAVSLKGVERDERSELDFWNSARKNGFRDQPAWLSLVTARLQELGSS